MLQHICDEVQLLVHLCYLQKQRETSCSVGIIRHNIRERNNKTQRKNEKLKIAFS